VVVTIALLAGATIGVGGASEAGAAVRRVSAEPVDASTLAGRDLLAYIPLALRGRCIDGGAAFDDTKYPQAIVTSFSASLNCSTAAGERIYYWKFDNRAGADALLENLVTVDNYKDASTDLSDCPSATTYSTTEDGKKRRGGRVFCFLAGEGIGLPVGTPVVEWTDERLGIVGQAYNVDDPQHVHRFFARESGPLTKPDRTGIPTARTAVALRNEGKALLALVPKASTSGCTIVDDLSEAALGSLYVWRLWIVADVEECRPKGGPEEVEYVRFGNADAMAAYYADSGIPNPAQNARELHGITCPGSNTYKAHGRRAGSVKCFFASIDTDGRQSVDSYFHLEWSSKPTKVVAFAISPADTEAAVVNWWADRGGPVVD
jgi:hypothetical protein